MNRRLFVLIMFIGLVNFTNAQTTPTSSVDYNLMGYPKSVRYMKFEADTNLKKQRTSYIEDYLLEFNENRLLTKRVNYIGGQPDRSTIFDYNSKRQLIKETIKEKDGRIASQITYTYNTIGRLATLTEISYPNSRAGANKIERVEVYTYSSKGLLVEKDVRSDNNYANKNIKYFYGPADSLISTITTYSYNSNIEKLTIRRAFNNLAMEKIWTRNDKQTRRETYTYDDNLMIESKEVYNTKNKKILTYTYNYDEHFNLVSEIAIDANDVKTIDYSYKYQKDKYFNWTKRTIYDSWAIKYTEVRTIEYYDKTHFYDDLKDMDTKRVITDKQEKPTNRSREYKDQPINR